MPPAPDIEAVTQHAQQAWENDPAIRAEFGSLTTYVAFEKAVARGQIASKFVEAGTPPATTNNVTGSTDPKQRWENDPAIRAEFGTLERYQAWDRANAEGRARVLARVVVDGSEAHQAPDSVNRPPQYPATQPTSHSGESLAHRQAIVRQENVGRAFAGLPPLAIPMV